MSVFIYLLFFTLGNSNAILIDESCDSPFECFLSNLTITLPDVNISLKNDTIALSLTRFVCTNFTLTTLTSTLLSDYYAMELYVGGLGLACTADWSYSEIDGRLHGNGTFELAVQESSIDLIILIESNGYQPTGAILSRCDTDINITSLELIGRMDGDLWNQISPTIIKILEFEIDKVICTGLSQAVNVNLSTLLLDAVQRMEPFLVPQPIPPIPEPPLPSDLVNWNNSDFFQPNGILSIIKPQLLNCVIDLITNYTGNFVLSINRSITLHPSPGEVILTLQSINISGLNTYSEFNLAVLDANHSLLTSIGLNSFGVDIEMELQFIPTSQFPLVEKFSAVLQLSDLQLMGDMLLALNSTILNHTLSQLSDRGCILSQIYSLNFTGLFINTTVAKLNLIPSGNEGLEGSIVELLDVFLDMFIDGFPQLITDLINGVTNEIVREKVNTLTTTLLRFYHRHHTCPPPVLLNGTDYIWWDNSSAIALIDLLINDKINATGFDSMISCLSGGQHSSSSTYNLNNGAMVVIGFDISGLNTFSNVSLLVPYPIAANHYTLNNVLALGGDEPLAITISFTLQQGQSFQSVNISLKLSELYILADIVLMVNRIALGNLPFSDLNHQCISSTFKQVGLSTLAIELGAMEVDVYYINETTGMPQLRNISGENITHHANSFLNTTTVFLQDHFNQRMLSSLEAAPYLCAGEPWPPLSSSSTWQQTTAIVVGVCGGVFLLFGICLFYRRWRLKQQPKGLVLQDAVAERVDWSSGLMFHLKGGEIARFIIPVVISMNIALFIYSNVSVGAAVTLQLSADGKVGPSVSLFDFTLQNSVQDMWDAGIYPLSIMIAVFSGGWPYLKLVLMLVAWTWPIQMLPVRNREILLMWLDALGKWSLIDCYVMVMMMVAFRFHFGLAGLDVDVIVNPGWGFHTFLAATMLSLSLGHIILAFHRRSASDIQIKDDGPKEAFREHAYEAVGSRHRCTKCGQFVVFFTLALAIGLVSCGCALDSFDFEFKGLAGLILGPEATASYSLVKVGTSLPNSSSHPDNISVRWIQGAYFLYALAIPLCYLVVAVFMWLTPLTLKKQLAIFKLSEVFFAWSGLEVFIIALVASILEISTFAQFIIGDSCDGIDRVLSLPFFNNLLDGDDTCFDVITKLTHGCWILFVAAMAFIFVCMILQRVYHSALEDRVEEQYPAKRLEKLKQNQDNNNNGGGGGCRASCIKGFASVIASMGLIEIESSDKDSAIDSDLYVRLAEDRG